MQDDLDDEYSPSRWSNRFVSADEVIQHHVRFVTEESERIYATIPYETLAYGSGSSESLDLFGTNLPDDAPLLVYIHGGYWQELSKTLSAYPVEPLHTAGFKVLVVGYSLCPIVTLAAVVEQICSAAKYIGGYAERMGSRHISYAGHSAGAHLILCMANQLLRFTVTAASLKRLHSLFLISGVYDVRDLRWTSINKANLLSINDDNVKRLSPATFNYAGWPATVNIQVFVGQHDSATFIAQSEKLHRVLSETYKLRCTYVLVPDCDHFELVELLAVPHYQISRAIVATAAAEKLVTFTQ